MVGQQAPQLAQTMENGYLDGDLMLAEPSGPSYEQHLADTDVPAHEQHSATESADVDRNPSPHKAPRLMTLPDAADAACPEVSTVGQTYVPTWEQPTAPASPPRTPKTIAARSTTPPPTTPRNKTIAARSTTPPPMVQKHSHLNQRPPLLRALQRNSAHQVRVVLSATPEAAKEPFEDHNWEPPICCAVRLKCGAEIVQLLLDHGASPDEKDIHGHTPIQILQKQQDLVKASAKHQPFPPLPLPMPGRHELASIFPQAAGLVSDASVYLKADFLDCEPAGMRHQEVLDILKAKAVSA